MNFDLINGGCFLEDCVCIDKCECDDPDCPRRQGEWFSGQCFECRTSDIEKEDALRMARIKGCWEGCYCSWNCLKKAIERTGGNSIGRLALNQQFFGQKKRKSKKKSTKNKKKKTNVN